MEPSNRVRCEALEPTSLVEVVLPLQIELIQSPPKVHLPHPGPPGAAYMWMCAYRNAV